MGLICYRVVTPQFTFITCTLTLSSFVCGYIRCDALNVLQFLSGTTLRVSLGNLPTWMILGTPHCLAGALHFGFGASDLASLQCPL